MDRALTEALNGLLARHDALEDPVSVFEHAGEVLFVGVLLLLLVLGGRALRRAALAAGASAALALAVGQVLARLVDRPRPFAAGAHVVLFAPHVADPGFPSDHATGAFAVAAAVTGYDRRIGGVLLGLAAALAVGRVALGYHYPTDVLGGAALGIAAALLVRRSAVRRWLEAVADRITGRPAFRSHLP